LRNDATKGSYMSNKTKVLIVIIIVAIAAALVWFLNVRDNTYQIFSK